MDPKNVDQNLLFALLALKMGLVDNKSMVDALNAWSARKDQSVGRTLVLQQVLPESRLAVVEQTFADLLESAGGDPYRGTVSLRLPAGLIETNLERINDPDLRAALARLEGAEVAWGFGAKCDLVATEFDAHLSSGAVPSASARVGHSATVEAQPLTQPVTVNEPVATDVATGAWPTGPVTEPDGDPGVTDAFPTSPSAGPAVEEPCPTEPLPMGIGLVPTVEFPAAGANQGVEPEATVALDALERQTPPQDDKPQTPEKRGKSRYRSLRPLARGGLGEVFVALDEELGREVALKEIQGRHLHHPESRARFLMEAEVTGGLEHPGIVPVYGLGQYPDGRPYYAMRFIRGRTLKEAIDAYHEANAKKKRDPSQSSLELRALLNRVIDVCNALAYAHTRGILHRDIKPANIMLGGFGETLVVDWGLAKAVDRPEAQSESEPGLPPLRPLSAGSSGTGTMYGTTVGTPHFMSPEQAAGELDRLGPASDVYSVGAMLYSILVGRLPFQEPQLALLLSKVRKGHFAHPRAVNRKVPAPLEAICLKAMALRVEDRYPTARAMADDLEHWLADEPVSVYREPWTARLARWAKRHRTFVITSTALVLAALVALSIGTALIRREQARTEANFRLARDAVDQMLTRLAEVELADVPQMEPVRRRMLDKARTFYDGFLADRGGDRSIRHETGRANLRLGDIEEMLGNYPAAEAAYRRAIALASALVAEQHRGDDDARRTLASTEHQLGVLLKKSNRFTESERALREAQRLRQALAAASPDNADDQRDEMESVYQLGTVLARLGRLKEVKESYTTAVDAQRKLAAAHPEQRDYSRKLGRYLNNRGMLERSTSADQRPAEATFREALELQKPLAEKSTSVAGLQWERARTTSNLAGALVETRGPGQAVPVYREALAQLKRLADDYPSVPDYQSELAIVSFNLGSTLLREAGSAERTGDHDAAARLRSEASEPLAAATEIYRTLIQPERFPHRPDYRQKLAQAERKRGMLLATIGQTAEAETVFRSAVKDLKDLETQYPQVPEYQSELGVALQNLALNQLARKQPAEARRLSDDAIAEQRRALNANPKDPFAQHYLLEAYEVLEAALGQLGDHTGTALAADALAEVSAGDPIANYRSARMLCASASMAATAAGLSDAQRKELADSRAALALKRLQEAVKQGAKVLPRDLDAPGFNTLRARYPEALDALKRALEARANPKVG